MNNYFGDTGGGTSGSISQLTQFELEQLSNIGSTSIPPTAWGNISGLNQTVATTSSPSFAKVTTLGDYCYKGFTRSVSLGFGAGYNNNCDNTVVGHFAGGYLINGNFNTLVGTQSGAETVWGRGITSGSNNTLIGNCAGVNSGTASNAIALGCKVIAPANGIVIGNATYNQTCLINATMSTTMLGCCNVGSYLLTNAGTVGTGLCVRTTSAALPSVWTKLRPVATMEAI